MSKPDITVLCGLGQHPGSHRPRAARADAAALAFALTVGGTVRAVDAGDPNAPGLRDYLGQTAGRRSLERLDVLSVPSGHDIRPALIAYLAEQKPDLVLTGARAETGEGSGMLAFDLAAALGYGVVPALCNFTVGERGELALTQALPKGRRRALTASSPLIATVDLASMPRGVFAGARARRGEIRAITPTVDCPLLNAEVDISPARARPKRLRKSSGGSAMDRLRAASESQVGQGNLLVDPPADEAARAILDYLRGEGLIGSGS